METTNSQSADRREGHRLSPQDLLGMPQGLGAGHAACTGCSAPSIVQAALHVARQALGCEPVVTFASSCVEVATTLYPRNAWRVPYLHAGRADSAAAASGIEAALRARRFRDEIPADRDIKVITFLGESSIEGGGLEALLASMARGHDLTCICYNNLIGINWPSNTRCEDRHIARSGVDTRASVDDLTRMMIACGIPYVAQASVHRYSDMAAKLQKAIAVRGPGFVNVLSTCPVGWGLAPSDDILACSELAVDCNLWPLYECEDGRYQVTYRPKQVRSVSDYLRSQGRFRHLSEPCRAELMQHLQERADRQWQELNDLERLARELRLTM